MKTQIQKEIGSSEEYHIKLADLVMMQMAGDFDSFLRTFTNNQQKNINERIKSINEQLQKTRENITTPQLFPKIVDKTIQAQFGEKHATLRELGQNGIDSYSSSDSKREVIFLTEENDEKILLRVRDKGCGMDLETLIRDLLVPYNSGKEGDPTKIGEHGIGWYSIVDLAKKVHVITKSKKNGQIVRASVYPTRNGWETSINPSFNQAPDYFQEIQGGTEIEAQIDKKDTDKEAIKNFLYQYLGFVDQKNGIITLNGDVVNFLRDGYSIPAVVPVSINGVKDKLAMSFSDRELDNFLQDSRFVFRNNNLDKIVLTQRGLFIKYDSNPFHSNSIHNKVFRELTGLGIDFWIEIPEHATLTKGRNSIIADNQAPVLEATYKAFEDLFVDSILPNQRIMSHSSNAVLYTVAEIFRENYDKSGSIDENEKRKYSFKRKFLSNTSGLASKTLDNICQASSSIKKAAIISGKKVFYEFPKAIFYDIPKSIIKDRIERKKSNPDPLWKQNYEEKKLRRKEKFKKLGQSLKKNTKALGIISGIGTGIGAGGYGLGIGAWKLYEKFGDKLWKYGLEGAIAFACGALATYGATKIYRNRESVGEYVGNFLNDLKDGTLKKDLISFLTKERHLPNISLPEREILLSRFGLYRDTEAKRELKREKKINKISKKYISAMCRNDFLKRIMNKDIIPVQYGFLTTIENDKKIDRRDMAYNVKELFKSLFNPDPRHIKYPQSFDAYGNPIISYVPKKSRFIERKNAKISIEKLVNLYIEGKLCPDTQELREGEYSVDKTHPVAGAVLEKLYQSKCKIQDKYDVKVLEDHLDNILDKTKSFSAGTKNAAIHLSKSFLYLTGLGPALIIGKKYFKHIPNPYGGSKIEQNTLRAYDGILDLPSNLKNMAHLKKNQMIMRRNENKPLENSSCRSNDSYGVNKYSFGKKFLSSIANAGKLAQDLTYRIYQSTKQGLQNKCEYVLEELKRRKETRAETRMLKETSKQTDQVYKQKEREKRKQEKIERQIALKKIEEQYGIHFRYGDQFRAKIKKYYNFVLRRKSQGYAYSDFFEYIPLKRFNRITEISQKGSLYRDYVKIVDSFQEIISKSLGMEKLPIVVSGRLGPVGSTRKGIYNDISFVVNSGNMLSQIDIRLEEARWRLQDSMDEIENNDRGYTYYTYDKTPRGITKFCYGLLDDLIHNTAHIKTKSLHQSSTTKTHPLLFYETKADISRKVIKYMEDNKINLEEIASPYIGIIPDSKQAYDSLIALQAAVNFLNEKVV
jgi:hypothetical protein